MDDEFIKEVIDDLKIEMPIKNGKVHGTIKIGDEFQFSFEEGNLHGTIKIQDKKYTFDKNKLVN